MLKTSKNAASEAKDLERSYKLADIVKQRQKTLRTLDLQPGEKVYDIGLKASHGVSKGRISL